MISLNNTLGELCESIDSLGSKTSITKETWKTVWTIYKFDNGFCFAFRQWNGSLTYYSTVAGLYAYKDRYDLPKNQDGTPLFKKIDYLDYQMRIGNGFTVSAYSNGPENTGEVTDHCYIYALSNSSGTQKSWVTLQVYGRWK